MNTFGKSGVVQPLTVFGLAYMVLPEVSSETRQFADLFNHVFRNL